MKREGNLFERIYSKENIILAHTNARKGKLYYEEVKRVDGNLEYYVDQIHDMLKGKLYKNSPYSIFQKKCGNKTREIYKLPYYPDRIIQHAVMQIIEPIWMSVFIYDTYASMKKRGIHAGVRQVKRALTDLNGTQYCLKIDIKKFYPSLDHVVLKDILRRKIKDKDLLWLLDLIIDSCSPGVPIGNYLSQYFANLYLAYFDHWCKENLKLKYYFRYCDDIVILHSDKMFLNDIFKTIKWYLNYNLKLTLKENYQVFPVTSRGIDFLGYRFYHTHTLLRKSIVKNMKRRLRKNQNKCTVAAYYGWLKHGNCYNLRKKYTIDYESKFKGITGKIS